MILEEKIKKIASKQLFKIFIKILRKKHSDHPISPIKAIDNNPWYKLIILSLNNSFNYKTKTECC